MRWCLAAAVALVLGLPSSGASSPLQNQPGVRGLPSGVSERNPLSNRLQAWQKSTVGLSPVGQVGSGSKRRSTYDLIVLYDPIYANRPRWPIRIDRAVNALNTAFEKYDIIFRVRKIALWENPGVDRLEPEFFEALAAEKGQADFVVLFSGQKFRYVSGKASEKHAVLIVCAQAEELEEAVTIHEMGHLFGLEHVKDKSGRNYMLPSGHGRKPDHFIPENEEIIRQTRWNGLGEKELSGEDARARLELLLRIYRNYTTDHFILGEIGNAYFKLGDFRTALSFYQKLLDYLDRLRPADADSTRDWYRQGYRAIALTYRKLGRQEDAIEAYDRALQYGPVDARFYAELAWTYGALRRWPEAVEAYRKVTRLQPDFAEAHCNLGVAYGEMGRYELALESYRQAIGLKSDFLEAYRNLGIAYSRLGRWQEAAEAFREVLRFEAGDAEAYFNLGVALSQLGQQEGAVKAYSAAIRTQPELGQAHRNLGVAYARLGEYRKAVQSYRKAIRIDPKDVEAHYDLGVTYLVLNDRRSAIAVQERLKSLSDSLATELLKLIRESRSRQR